MASENDDVDREAILTRRNTLLRRTLHTVGVVTLAAAANACGEAPCLGAVYPDGGDAASNDASADGAPMPCLSRALDDASSD